MSTREGTPSLSGDLVLLPFTGKSLTDTVRKEFLELRNNHDAGTLLILCRSPTEVETVERALSQGHEAIKPHDDQSLIIQTVSGHALETLGNIRGGEENAASLTVLKPNQQYALLVASAKEYEWKTEYLQQASEYRSFYRDLSSFITDALINPLEVPTDPILADLAEFAESFYNQLRNEGFLPRQAVRREAVASLQSGTYLSDSPIAVLTVGFEDFTPIDREYLGYVSSDSTLRCIARSDSSVFRTWVETGRIEDTPGLDVDNRQVQRKLTVPQSVASILATGETRATSDQGRVTHIHEEQFTDHIRSIGTEILTYTKLDGNSYDDIAVVFRDSRAPVDETINLLWNMGIPVSSVSANGLEHDPTARELYAVSQLLRARANGETPDPQHERTIREKLEQSSSHESAAEIVETALDAANLDRITDSLGTWINRTGLKARVAESNESMQTRLVYKHVKQILELARFFDNEFGQFYDQTWDTFVEALEGEFERTASMYLATDLETQETGVTVDTAGTLKGFSFDVVFMAGVVEGEYPGDPQINRLFPTHRAPELDAYPRITNPTREDVEKTFRTPIAKTRSLYRSYNHALDRRLLAIGSALASGTLVFCTYSEARSGTGRSVEPSRYLDILESEVKRFDAEFEPLEHRSPERIALSEFDEILDDARRRDAESFTEEELDTRFSAISAVLAERDDSELTEAFRSRLDWEQGVVADE